MKHFIREQNIALYKTLIAESERNPSRDEKRHQMLLRLLAQEMAADRRPSDGRSPSGLFAETTMAAERSDGSNRKA